MSNRLNLVTVGLWSALILALVGSLRHVAWAFATLEGGDLLWGYVQAGAVDVGLVALAYAVHQRRRERRPTWTLWAGVLLFSAISAYANLLHGLRFASDMGLSAWAQARPFLLSGVLPVLVVYLSEIVSADVQHAVRVAEKERRAAERRARREVSVAEGSGQFPYPVEQARALLAEQRARSKAEALDALLDILAERPDVRVTDLARLVGRSRSTVYTYVDELEAQGRLRRNGDGLEVVR
jgi:hypothetical protein